jgi:hypothetical protein
MGFRSDLQRFPDQHFSVATLCNVANSNPSQLARSVASVYLEGQMGPLTFTPRPADAAMPAANRPVVTLTEAELKQWVGNYARIDNASPRVISVENGKLWTTVTGNKTELTPHGPADFSVTVNGMPVQLRFERNADGRRIRQWFNGQEGQPLVESAPPGPISGAYAGTYRSDELGSSFIVTVVGETIQVKLPTGGTATLRQLQEGVFIGGGNTVRFDPLKDGKAPGFSLDLGRVRGLRFVREN